MNRYKTTPRNYVSLKLAALLGDISTVQLKLFINHLKKIVT